MPNEFNLKTSFQDLEDLRDGLLSLRERKYLGGDVEHFVKYSWAIEDAEKTLRERARIADQLFRLFGVPSDTADDLKAMATIAEAKAQKAALKALEDDEAAREAADA